MFIGVYGCQMNFSDAERMEGELEKIGYSRIPEMETADLILLVTCCVRESAEERVYGKIGEVKRLKRDNPKLIFGIAGCMAQKEQDELIRRAPHIDFVLGTGKIEKLATTVSAIESERKEHIVDAKPSDRLPDESFAIRRAAGVSAWVPVMYGCDNFCTYCIVPYVRGRERSRLPDDILREAEAAAREGFREITFLGQNVNSYGKDHGLANFSELLRRADRVEGIERVRFMTSHPKDLSDDLIDAVAGGTHLCEHFHLPVQHGSDRILKLMNRSYTQDTYRELVGKIRERIPRAAITTDIIVGFPGETEEDFSETLALIREMRFDSAYTFMYSPRSGTPAARMGESVPDEVKRERLRRLMAAQDEISLAINEGYREKTVEVLAEGSSQRDASIWTGRTREGKTVLWPHSDERAGELIKVRITKPQTWVLKGVRGDCRVSQGAIRRAYG